MSMSKKKSKKKKSSSSSSSTPPQQQQLEVEREEEEYPGMQRAIAASMQIKHNGDQHTGSKRDDDAEIYNVSTEDAAEHQLQYQRQRLQVSVP